MGLSSVHFSSVAQLCPTLCDSMSCGTPGFPVHYSRSLPKLMSTESVMPSNQLILCHPLFFLPSIFPSIRVWIFKWVSSLHQVATVLEFQLQHLTGLKPGVNRAAFLLEILGEDPSPCLFQLVDAPHIPWLVVPSAIFRTSKSFSDSVSLVLPLWPPSSTFKDAYD